MLNSCFPEEIQTSEKACCKACKTGVQFVAATNRQLRERHTKLEDFASWLELLRWVQGGEVQRLQQEETALALWEMYLSYGGKPLEQYQDKFDEMKEESAAVTKVCSTCPPCCCCLWLTPA